MHGVPARIQLNDLRLTMIGCAGSGAVACIVSGGECVWVGALVHLFPSSYCTRRHGAVLVPRGLHCRVALHSGAARVALCLSACPPVRLSACPPPVSVEFFSCATRPNIRASRHPRLAVSTIHWFQQLSPLAPPWPLGAPYKQPEQRQRAVAPSCYCHSRRDASTHAPTIAGSACAARFAPSVAGRLVRTQGAPTRGSARVDHHHPRLALPVQPRGRTRARADRARTRRRAGYHRPPARPAYRRSRTGPPRNPRSLRRGPG